MHRVARKFMTGISHRIWATISPTEDIDINARFMWAWFDNWEPENAEGRAGRGFDAERRIV